MLMEIRAKMKNPKGLTFLIKYREECTAQDILALYDSLTARLNLHEEEEVVESHVAVQFTPGGRLHLYYSRLELLDMIFTTNAYSTAHNGTKIFM